MKKKKVKGKMIVLLVMTLLMLTSSVGSAASVGRYLEYYHSAVYRKLVATTPIRALSPTSQKGPSFQYYKVYDANSKLTYSCDWKRLCTPLVFDKETKSYNIESITLGVQQGVSWASTTTNSFGTSQGVEVGFSAPSDVLSCASSFSYNYTYSKAHTTTRTDTQNYSATLSKNSKEGLYYWAAVLYYDAYEYDCYYKAAGTKNYYLARRATFFTFKYNTPVIKLVRQDLK